MLYERVKVKGRLDGKKGYGRKKEEITGEPHEKKGDKMNILHSIIDHQYHSII